MWFVELPAVAYWGRHGETHQRDVAVRMGESAELLGARFVISVGDNFYVRTVSPAWTIRRGKPPSVLFIPRVVAAGTLARGTR